MKAIAYTFPESVTDIKLETVEVTKEDTVPEQNKTKWLNSCPPHVIIHITHLQKGKQDIQNIVKTLEDSATFQARCQAHKLIMKTGL